MVNHEKGAPVTVLVRIQEPNVLVNYVGPWIILFLTLDLALRTLFTPEQKNKHCINSSPVIHIQMIYSTFPFFLKLERFIVKNTHIVAGVVAHAKNQSVDVLSKFKSMLKHSIQYYMVFLVNMC